VIVANDPTIKGGRVHFLLLCIVYFVPIDFAILKNFDFLGTYFPITVKKHIRAQEIAQQVKCCKLFSHFTRSIKKYFFSPLV